MSLSLRRYQESPRNNSGFLLTQRQSNSKFRNFSLSNSTAGKNPEVDALQLPSLSSRASLRKSFSTTFESDRNTKFKLVTLSDKLDEIKDNLHTTRRETNESIQLCAMLRQSLLSKELGAVHKSLKKQISGLQGLVNSIKFDNRSRSDDLKDSCNRLWESTENCKCEVFNLRMKVDDLEAKMGYQQ